MKTSNPATRAMLTRLSAVRWGRRQRLRQASAASTSRPRVLQVGEGEDVGRQAYVEPGVRGLDTGPLARLVERIHGHGDRIGTSAQDCDLVGPHLPRRLAVLVEEGLARQHVV